MTITPSQFVAAAQRLGNGRPYVLDTTGPDSYDCSGLVYRALVELKIYNGARFSTRDWTTRSSDIATPVSTPAVGDIVLWSAHMGIVDGPDLFYSAYSPARGILDTKISRFPGTPRYYRLDVYAIDPVPAVPTIPDKDDEMLALIIWGYNVLVGRAPSNDEIIARISDFNGWGSAQIVKWFLDSKPEPASVTAAFNEYLGHAPNDAQMAQWVASPTIRYLRGSRYPTAGIAGSPEARAR